MTLCLCFDLGLRSPRSWELERDRDADDARTNARMFFSLRRA